MKIFMNCMQRGLPCLWSLGPIGGVRMLSLHGRSGLGMAAFS
jgi:hypothetical protein